MTASTDTRTVERLPAFQLVTKTRSWGPTVYEAWRGDCLLVSGVVRDKIVKRANTLALDACPVHGLEPITPTGHIANPDGSAMTLGDFLGLDIEGFDAKAYADEIAKTGEACEDCIYDAAAGLVGEHCARRLPAPCWTCGRLGEAHYIFRDTTGRATNVLRAGCPCAF